MLTQPQPQQMAQLQRQRQHQHQQQRQQAGKQPIQDRQLPHIARTGPSTALRSQQRRRRSNERVPRPPL